jgi:hypothetical protein
MADELLKALRKMNEDKLTKEVIVPLLRAMQPKGRIEFTHGPNERGRDLICLAPHRLLSRQSAVCVQVKNHKLSHGNSGVYSLTTVANQVENAASAGVVGPGNVCYDVDEVWVINTYPVTDTSRRDASEALKRIRRAKGIFIDGLELAPLLLKYCPQLVARLTSLGDAQIASLVADLSIHRESRAFGLGLDRNISEFFISARVFLRTKYSDRQLSNEDLIAEDMYVAIELPFDERSQRRLSGTSVLKDDIAKSPQLRQAASFATRYQVPLEWHVVRSNDDDVSIVPNAKISESTALGRVLAKQAQAARSRQSTPRLRRVYRYKVDGIYNARRRALRSAFNALLKKKIQELGDARAFIRLFFENEQFLSDCERLGIYIGPRRAPQEVHGQAAQPIPSKVTSTKEATGELKTKVLGGTLRIRDERQILDLGDRVLIEAGPGSGKTTFLRKLASTLLRSGKQVYFVECSKLGKVNRIAMYLQRHSEEDVPSSVLHSAIIDLCREGGVPKKWKLDGSVLIIDGFDELNPSLTTGLLDFVTSKQNASTHTIISCRDSFSDVRDANIPTLGLSHFSTEERNEFFVKWFKNDPVRLETAMSLIKSHGDVSFHTRTPLIATLVAALVEYDYKPTSRSAVYKQRLDLLLGEWDAVKGLQRSAIPLLHKQRFLEYLAYKMHSAYRREAKLEDVQGVVVQALGARSHHFNFEQLIDDLVKVSGILIMAGDELSFGHLSFQEHLAGLYLAKYYNTPKLLAGLLGKPWWEEPLVFCASELGDMTPLIDYCEEKGNTRAYSRQLLDIGRAAQFTQKVALEVLASG